MGSELVHILLIEDNEEQVQFLTQLLVTSDAVRFEVTAENALAAGLNRIDREKFEIILLDLTLPDSDGIETFVRVVERARTIPVVVLSGICDVAIAIETVQLGAQDYLVKGHVDNHLLVRSLQYAIERKRIQLQLKRAYEELELRVQERTAALRDANQQLQREISDRRRAEEAALESNRRLAEAMEQLRSAQCEMIERERMLALTD